MIALKIFLTALVLYIALKIILDNLDEGYGYSTLSDVLFNILMIDAVIMLISLLVFIWIYNYGFLIKI